MGPIKFKNQTMQIRYVAIYMTLANLLYKTKPHYSEHRTMLIRTMRGLAVRGLLLNFYFTVSEENLAK